MASVVTAAPTVGAPPRALHKLDKGLGATHARSAVIGKRLNRAKLFVFDEPTAGVASAPRRKPIGRRPPTREGAGVIKISSYLPEVLERTDGLHVFSGDRTRRKPRTRDASQEITLTEAIGA